jgi:hypothetical protein
MPPRSTNRVQPGIGYPTTAQHWQLSLELEMEWEGGHNVTNNKSVLEPLLRQSLKFRAQEIELEEHIERGNILQRKIEPFIYTPEELVRWFIANMDGTYFDPYRNQAFSSWTQNGLHRLDDKAQSLDQIYDTEFVRLFLQPYLEIFDTMFFSGSLVQFIQLTVHPCGTDIKLPGALKVPLKNCGGVTIYDFHQGKVRLYVKIAVPSTQGTSLIPREDHLRFLIMVLLHEMIHSFFLLASWSEESYSNIRILGPEGHGAYWQLVVTWIERFAGEHLQLPLTFDRTFAFAGDLAICTRSSNKVHLQPTYLELLKVLGLDLQEVESFRQLLEKEDSDAKEVELTPESH